MPFNALFPAVLSNWSWDAPVLAAVAIPCVLYLLGVKRLWGRAGRGRGASGLRVAAFGAGVSTVFLALVSPLDHLAASLFAAHMLQHLLLILVAAPAIALSQPLYVSFWAVPRPVRRVLAARWKRSARLRRFWQVLTLPPLVWLLHAVILWTWHLPELYQLALVDEPIHAVEHVSFFGTAFLFWWTVAHAGSRGGMGYGLAIPYTFLMGMQSSVLGVLLTFSRVVWYPVYAVTSERWGLTPLQDQQLAGLIMWIPSGLVYVGAVSFLVVAWLQAEERAAREREASWDAELAGARRPEPPLPSS